MIIEIPDLDVILGLILAFIGGLVTLFVYSKLKAISASNDQTKADLERMEFYERQLIDLKIKLDAIDLENLTFSQETPQNIVKNEEKPAQVVQKQVEIVPEPAPNPPKVERAPNMSSDNIVEAVLRLITDKSRTSRDIQITLGKSREHISRTMKKMTDDGLVERNTNAKPYSYSITQMGLSKLSGSGSVTQTVAPQTS
ncbi:MAG: MarR family transcriptional regulator [Candidatus Nitrosopelagicus sp.]|nr:MAG: MarR family transcriptional regulator [Candidatus Nitrosopelagicus sp.]